jgi:hypothetical protein
MLENLTWLLICYVLWQVIKRILYIILESVANKRERSKKLYNAGMYSNEQSGEMLILNIEKMSGIYYAWKWPENQFLAQGNSISEMVKRVSERTKITSFNVAEATSNEIAQELEEQCLTRNPKEKLL